MPVDGSPEVSRPEVMVPPHDASPAPAADEPCSPAGPTPSPIGQPWESLYVRPKFTLKSLFPPSTWVPRYVRSLKGETTENDERFLGTLPNSIKGDLIAGLTVGIMLVPQCLAFALLAGLPVQVGLYTSFLPLIVYALFGTMRQVQTGPTALMSLLTGQALDAMNLALPEVRMAGASFLALMVGIFSVFLGLLRFGAVTDFMSHSVMSAFCTASGVIIATSQLKDMLGLSIPRTHYWWETIRELALKIEHTHAATTVLGFSILFFLLFLKFWKTAGSKEKRQKSYIWRWFPKDNTSIPFKLMKLNADLSSFWAVLLGALIAWALREADVEGVRVVGNVNADGFIFVLPGEGHYDELTSGSDLFVSAIVIALIGFLETVAVGGKFAAQKRYEYDPNQDLIALGLSNLGSAFMGGFSTTGGFSRTAVNVAFGATSLFSCALSSILVVLAMYVLLPAIAWIPKSSMAPIIIQGAMGVIDIHEFKVAFKTRPTEFLVMFLTFAVSLILTVKEGLLVGFVCSVFKTLHEISSPNLAVVAKTKGNWRDIRHFPDGESIPGAVVVRMDARLHFANSRKLKEFCLRAIRFRESQVGGKIKHIIIDMKSMNGIDLTGVEMLHVLAESLNKRGQSIVLVNLKAPIASCLESAGLLHTVQKYGGHFALDIPHAEAILRQAEPDWGHEEEQVLKVAESAEANQVNGKVVSYMKLAHSKLK